MPRQRTDVRRIAGGMLVGSAVLIGALVLRSPKGDGANRSPRTAADTGRRASEQAPAGALATPIPQKNVPATKDSAPAKAKPKPDSAAAASSPIVAPLEQFRRAINAGSVAVVARAFPSITDEQRKFFENLFSTFEDIKAKQKLAKVSAVSGDIAHVAYSLHVTYRDRKSKVSSYLNLDYDAMLQRNGKKWNIADLKQR
jgi:ketosteroid isomerase-like protein